MFQGRGLQPGQGCRPATTTARQLWLRGVQLPLRCSIGAAMLGAGHVLGIDIDRDALATAQSNVAEFEEQLPVRLRAGGGKCRFALPLTGTTTAHMPSRRGPSSGAVPNCCPPCALPFSPLTPQIDFVRCDVRHVGHLLRWHADTVIMNPPFGTRRKGADMEFLKAAFALSCGSIYSLHKSSTRDHIARVAEKELRAPSGGRLPRQRTSLVIWQLVE